MKRVGLGTLMMAWLYGVPFLLIVGLVRRASDPYLVTRAAADRFGSTTDTILVTALVLNLALPVTGLLLAQLVGDGYWRRHFAWSLAGVCLIFLAYAGVAAAAATPLTGWTPGSLEPEPRVSQCIPTSGGRGCPGG